ncbi:heterodisulfide reductase-related iron-sulfur binding cluster [Methylocapsa palsarum]|uniref:Glycerol-3-phosphate dehydrogenase subunit C n=1 Tax=Methylocapsa palsarum TaxID=1612308 RepID=A0A1I3ZRT6_9HYPH|nr:heterodisulfide reductase-related iron-sulfur binding cluster [Methylocapsa palsarum]SFK46386.1 glycerol-3-phosphate dehydrogenase subunit C [Methylocapsa palsarum]
MSEGGLAAPSRHPLDWRSPDFYDEAKLDAEARRIFDICHGCRRCFNLCDSFPRLFDLVDACANGELDTVESKDFKPIVDACTLCDMCYMTKCPYVPPHEFNLDFPHLMLRYRAVEAKKGEEGLADRELAKTDRNGKLAAYFAPLANWTTRLGHKTARIVVEKAAGLDRRAWLPSFVSKSLVDRAADSQGDADSQGAVNRDAPAHGRKAVIYATCYANYNDPDIGLAARAVLAKNGVETEVVHPRCCGMPLLEQGEIGEVAKAAKEVASAMRPWIEKGYDVVALVPSCALMLKSEWPLILPEDEDVKLLSKAAYDLSEYVVGIARKEGIAPGMQPVAAGGVALHISCHSRAQNIGQKARDLLRLIPEAKLQVIERCSGHGGAWGCKTGNFETALKVGAPVARQVAEGGKAIVTSECPLAGRHIAQGVENLGGADKPELYAHPIQLIAKAYGLENSKN